MKYWGRQENKTPACFPLQLKFIKVSTTIYSTKKLEYKAIQKLQICFHCFFAFLILFLLTVEELYVYQCLSQEPQTIYSSTSENSTV